MMRPTKIYFAITAFLLLGSLGVTALAQNVANLVPYQSFIKTANTNLAVSSSLASAFTATPVSCPASHTAGCTIRVRVSTQFTVNNLTPYVSHFYINVATSAAGTVWPNALVDFGYFEPEDGVLVHSYEWMKTGVPAGSSQTVTIKFKTDAGTGKAGYRLAAIDTFLN